MPLSRDEVLQGALRLLDDEGLEALTMRRLADALDVQAGAIYWHFANKQELYDAMIEEILAGLLEPPPSGRWDVQLAELTRRIAGALGGRRDGAVLMTKALRPGPSSLALSERMLAVARDAGFGKTASISATSVLGYYVLGYVTDMQATQAAKARGLRAILRSFAKTIDPARYPQLAGFGSDAMEMMTTERRFRERFEFGLEIILDGLRATLRSGGRARAGSRRRVAKKRR